MSNVEESAIFAFGETYREISDIILHKVIQSEGNKMNLLILANPIEHCP